MEPFNVANETCLKGKTVKEGFICLERCRLGCGRDDIGVAGKWIDGRYAVARYRRYAFG